MIVKNEERNLARCLDSVNGLTTETVIVNTGSSDATARIATDRGARVFSFDFSVVDFAAARNHAVAQATGEWILVLDADEALDTASHPLVCSLVDQNENAGYYFERLNYRTGSPQPTRDYVVRLFPRRHGWLYRGRVHETIDASILAGGGRLVPAGIRIRHEFASDPLARRRRNLLYMRILIEEIAADPRDISRLGFLAAECHQLGMFRQAAQILAQITHLTPLDPVAHLHLGAYHLLYRGDSDQARTSLTKALDLRPGYPDAESFLHLIGAGNRDHCPVVPEVGSKATPEM